LKKIFQSISKPKYFIAPLSIFLLSFILRLLFISKGPFHLDTLNLSIKAAHFAQTFELQGLFGSGYPLTVILGGIFVFLGKILNFNDPIICINFMSVLTSSIALLYFYVIAEKIYSRTSATFATVLFSITPIFLGLSVYGKSHTPSIMFLLISLYYLLLFKELNKKSLLILSALALGAMGACRLQDMILMIIPISYALLFLNVTSSHPPSRHTSNLLKTFLIFFSFTSLFIIIFHSPFFLHGNYAEYKLQWDSFFKQGVSSNYRGFTSDAFLLSFNYILQSTSILGVSLSVCGLFITFLKNKKLTLFLLLWFCIPFLFYGNLWTTAPRFFLLILPPLFLAMGQALSIGFQKTLIHKTVSVLTITLLAFIYLTSIMPAIHFRASNQLLPDFYQWVASTTENNAYIISGDDRLFIEYYSHRKSFPKPLENLKLSKESLTLIESNLNQY
jgi:4-amino-4-deoxy-L-arabinose transferase-like glycosyltransferase